MGKLDEVVYLAEWPSVLRASIDERYLELPERIVITAMQSHQRYFPVRSGGPLEPRFLFVANGGDPTTVVRRGNEEVLVGRLTTPSSPSRATSSTASRRWRPSSTGSASWRARVDRRQGARLVPLVRAAV